MCLTRGSWTPDGCHYVGVMLLAIYGQYVRSSATRGESGAVIYALQRGALTCISISRIHVSLYSIVLLELSIRDLISLIPSCREGVVLRRTTISTMQHSLFQVSNLDSLGAS